MLDPEREDGWKKRLWDEWSLPPSDRDRDAWRSRLGADLRRVLARELDTRRFLSAEVYGVPDEWLDELVRVRLADLAATSSGRGPGSGRSPPGCRSAPPTRDDGGAR